MRIIVTGANRGIGRALVETASARGDAVTGTTRGTPERAGWLRLDVTDPGSVRAMAEAFGTAPLDLLVCNAGVYIDKGEDLASGYPAGAWAATFAVNVTGVFLTVQALLPNLRAGKGKVAIVSSRMGSQALAPGGSYIYRASKAAAVNLGRNLAADLRPEGIAVGIYHPGWVRTDMGGAGADVAAGDAARGLMARFDALSLATTGCYEDWQGQAIPL
ncbi:MAG: short-chain dehydrogenase [Rhodobacterales bacterium 32-67-9]|nr:MAG: short-chain dehydrogenase [Rhodobacterales bacterium 32-67-9]